MTCIEAAERARALHPPAAQSVGVLLVSTGRSDAEMLRPILEESSARLTAVRSYRDAVTALRRDAFAVVICEERLPDGSWKDILGHIAPLNEAPRLIVIAPEFRESLYGEVLNLGAWELLLRPLKADEARRVLEVGCEKFAGRKRPAHATAPDGRVAAAGA
jgi:DNA-binding NtrC family response regulator